MQIQKTLDEELEQSKYHTKILLGDFNLGKENVLKPSFGNARLHKDNNDNGVMLTYWEEAYIL